MPFMQETPRSLRLYLVLVGAVGTLSQLPSVLAEEGGPLARFLSLVGVAISLGYAWAGFTLKTSIITIPQRIEQVLITGTVYAIFIAVILIIFAPQAPETPGAIAGAVLGLLMTIYLLKNVRRLAKEGRAKAAMT